MVFLGRTKRIHFVGIGGIGMSGMAEVLTNLGFHVTGSDLRRTEITDRLRTLGASVSFEHDGANVEGADVVVYSSAVSATNPEVAAAGRLGIPVIPRTEMLAELMRLKFAVTVAGAHGKTSTTSLIAAVLSSGNLDPTVIVGGKLHATSSNARLGSGRYIVAEADESDGQFVRLPSSIAVITNIDYEHLDFYTNMTAIQDAFVEYANRVPFYGAVVLCHDSEHVRAIESRIQRRRITYSLGGEADLMGKVVSRDETGTRFTVADRDKEIGDIHLGIAGEHYVRNALAAVAVGIDMEVSFQSIKKGIEEFKGVGRRFEIKGESASGVLVVDDYGHHPTEIAATIAAARDNFGRRLFVLFQPHRYSRTQAMAEEFGGCFAGAYKVFITDIYPAGEDPIEGVDASTIIDRVRKNGVKVAHVNSFDEMVEQVVQETEKGDMVVTMGAGDITRVSDLVLDALGRR